MKLNKKIEVEISPEMQKLSEEIQEINNKVISTYMKNLDKLMERLVRENASPPIKGEITKGKLKWRGLIMCRCFETNETWIQQRGEDITPRISPKNIHKYL